MERVTFDDIMETLTFYKDGATNPRNDGWTHNHYRKWLKDIHGFIKEAAELPLHGK
tara:strand:+ start:434 stop:601 length:168 start_codon:yes stop_codon:yes gene_type:complete